MTENKKTVGEMCNDNRFELIEKAKQKLLKATNIETSQDEMKVLDSILFRVWQLGWLDNLEGPKTYEELRSLCIGIGTKDNHIWIHSHWGKGNEYLMTHSLKFYPDGKICMDGDNVNEFVIAENKSPKQMWAIIKSLLGEK